MSIRSPKAYSALALIDLFLSARASLQGTFGKKLKARETLRRLLSHRQSYLAPYDKARAAVQIDLAMTYLDGNIVDCMHADALLHDAQFILIKNYGAIHSKVARVLHMRGLLQKKLGDSKRCHTFHQAAETVYGKIRPLSFDRIANLEKLAAAQEAIALRPEALATRKLAKELNRVLLLQSVRRRY